MAAAAAFAAPAHAGVLEPIDPGGLPLPGTEADSVQGNAPMLAWRGEYLRITACTDNAVINVPLLRDVLQTNDLVINDILNSEVAVTAWSGKHEATAPKIMPSKASDWYLSNEGELCIKHVLMSTSDGLARVSQNVTLDIAGLADLVGPIVTLPGMEAGTADVDDLASILLDLFSENTRILSRQSLAGWMSLTQPQLSILDQPDEIVPGGAGVPFDVDVKGTMSMAGADFADYDFPETVTLPDAWPDMAKQLAEATDATIDKFAAQSYWDLHDTRSASPDQHVGGSACVGTNVTIDQVDNCAPDPYAPWTESFSRVFAGLDSQLGLSSLFGLTPLGLTTNGTIGPFDPVRTADTLLGDGQITPEDAPMPSTRIDFDLVGKSLGHWGVGEQLAADVVSNPFADPNADKREDYSRNGLGDNAAHNLYAPYYTSLIPATGTGEFLFNTSPVSGVDGAVAGRNSAPGFLVNGPYDFWDVAKVLSVGAEDPTKCNQWAGKYSLPRTTPEGAQNVAVYTDEHGEARANWFPGMGAFFDQLPNLNLGCDLESSLHPTLGTAQIQAIASYPDEPVAPDKKSAIIPLEVGNLFTKYLVDYAKGTISHDGSIGEPNGGDRNARVVIAHAQDINGDGFSNEKVCLSSAAADKIRFYGPTAGGAPSIGPWDLTGTSQYGPNGPQEACGKTNDDGNVAFEVYRADGNPVSDIGVVADFVDEGLLRSKKLDFADHTPPPPVDNPPVQVPNGTETPKPTTEVKNPGPTPPSNASTSVPTASELKANSISVSSASKAGKSSTRAALKWAVTGRLVRSAKGSAIRFRASGPAANAVKVQIKMLNKKGKTVRTRTLSVKPNRLIVLKSGIPASVTTIKLGSI